MKIKFWGTRGSIPTPGRMTEKYGGNTACIELEAGGKRLILDGGTGIRELGQELMGEGPSESILLFSHVHWDHIQGLPFFVPFFVPGYSFRIFALPALLARVEKVLTKQMEAEVFPVDFEALAAKISFEMLDPEGLDLGGVRVSAFEQNHPGGSYGYRIEADGHVLVYATDNEIDPDKDPGGFAAMVEKLRGVELLVADGQYTLEEYPQRIGWGHSAVPWVVRLAREAGVKRLAITHHDPMRNDEALSELERQTRKQAEDVQVFFAREGLVTRL